MSEGSRARGTWREKAISNPKPPRFQLQQRLEMRTLKIIWEKAMPRSHPHHLDTHHFLPPLLFLNNSCNYYSSYSSMFYNAPFNLALPHHPLARTSAPSLSLAHAPKPHCILQGVFLWGLCWEVVEKKEKKEEKKHYVCIPAYLFYTLTTHHL